MEINSVEWPISSVRVGRFLLFSEVSERSLLPDPRVSIGSLVIDLHRATPMRRSQLCVDRARARG